VKSGRKKNKREGKQPKKVPRKIDAVGSMEGKTDGIE